MCGSRLANRARYRSPQAHAELRRYAARSRPHPSPSPDRVARGRLSPKSRPHLFVVEEITILSSFRYRLMSVRDGTKHETDASMRGKSGEFVRWLFMPRSRESDERL